jgi:hypothetical protein
VLRAHHISIAQNSFRNFLAMRDQCFAEPGNDAGSVLIDMGKVT